MLEIEYGRDEWDEDPDAAYAEAVPRIRLTRHATTARSSGAFASADRRLRTSLRCCGGRMGVAKLGRGRRSVLRISLPRPEIRL